MKTFDKDQILKILDEGATSFRFPALDNGYVYPCASRLSLHRSPEDWAMVFETFGFSPRAGVPDLTVTTFASSLTNRKQRSDYVSEEAYRNYLANFPNNEVAFFSPFDDEAWIDDEDGECVNPQATSVRVRKQEIQVPDQSALKAAGITLEDPPNLLIFELCRYISETHAELVLGRAEEIQTNLPHGTETLLHIDAWHHPDTIRGELPSQTRTFQELAEVLATGDPAKYKATETPNSHWSNWPEGGTL